MKTRKSHGWVFGMVLGVVAATSGFARDSLNPLPATVSSDATGAALLTQGIGPASESSPAALSVADNAGDKSLSSSIPLSSGAQEIQSLTHAALDEHVILVYITNFAGIFNLNPDNIIYLRDVGVSTPIINAMILHDRGRSASPRPPTVSPASSLPVPWKAALAASLHLTGDAAAQPATPATRPEAPSEAQIMANDEAWTGGDLVLSEEGYAPEQPASTGPVRVPYAVKLNDPIIILKLPTFRVPYW
jgi:hypothetical protein